MSDPAKKPTIASFSSKLKKGWGAGFSDNQVLLLILACMAIKNNLSFRCNQICRLVFDMATDEIEGRVRDDFQAFDLGIGILSHK